MIKFLSNNLVETATIAASTTNAQYPLTNLLNDFRTKAWRSTSNSDNIVFDLGSAVDVDSFAIVDNWKNGFGITAMTIEAHTSDSWGAPSFSTTLTFDSTFGIGIKEFATETYQFWRIVLTSTLGYCELPYVFIGEAIEIGTNGVSYGYNYKNKDIKKVSTTSYGQEYIDTKTKRKELNNLKFEVMNNTEMDKLYEVYDDRGTTKPFILKLGDDTNTIISNENRLNGLYKLSAEPSDSPTTVGFWGTSLSVREQK
jgi:hypothetical protein